MSSKLISKVCKKCNCDKPRADFINPAREIYLYEDCKECRSHLEKNSKIIEEKKVFTGIFICTRCQQVLSGKKFGSFSFGHKVMRRLYCKDCQDVEVLPFEKKIVYDKQAQPHPLAFNQLYAHKFQNISIEG